jgi:hypothetical protein
LFDYSFVTLPTATLVPKHKSVPAIGSAPPMGISKSQRQSAARYEVGEEPKSLQ